RPRRKRQQLALLVLGRQAVRLLEPAFNRRVLAINDPALREEVAGKRGARRAFDHLLEPAARDHLGVNVNGVFDQSAKDTFLIAIAQEPPADAIRLDDPQRQRLTLPDSLCP